MGIPSIDPADVGLTGLIWLLLSYGYILYFASGMIGDGSELLLLVPSMAGLVGGVVLPLLGAVPDGAIILFSGLGDIEEAQETLSVGVGALAGSTIMLLTVPFFLSVYAGRVDIDDDTGKCRYQKKPKLKLGKSFTEELSTTGIALSDPIHASAKIMMITLLPYVLIQFPAFFIHGPTAEVAAGEKWYALAALLVCLAGLLYYMHIQLQMSQQGLDKEKRIAVMKKKLAEGSCTLTAALAPLQVDGASSEGGGYQSISGDEDIPPNIKDFLKEILKDPYHKYDINGDGTLDRKEAFTLFRDFNESINSDEFDVMFKKFDKSEDDLIDFEEFMHLAYVLIVKINKFTTSESIDASQRTGSVLESSAQMLADTEEENEEEELPKEITDLPPDQQQAAIKKKAFTMLLIGTILVVLFSDPMVDVLQEIANRAKIPAFYVAFVLAPLASNATEVLASQYYASKKTRKTITVGISALEGAAAMNNTFCLAIFMGLVYFRGLAWQYTAETLSIILVELFVGYLVLRGKVMKTSHGLFIGLAFPLSIAFVALLESYGID